ncbi:MAG: malonate-semialdehyde dehydrogenase (acetylating)/methylmalonate-semialdehyde dehydrogenase [Verrucomicrobiales bacterium]|jgi:malonate-semialdehyde dehydrogenase (acetylating)/methylmalonate-semialdehyde dehydrogenase
MRTIDVISPLDGALIGEIEVADAAAGDAAVTRSRLAFEGWSQTPVKDRVQPLFRFRQLVEDNIQELSELVTRENGKTVGESEAGIRKGLEVVEYATALPAIGQGRKLEVSRGVDCYSRSYPLGVVAGITPFNFPVMVPLWMFPLAIATGNTFLLKPSEQVPLASIRMGELLLEAGLPENVFQVVKGDRETVEALLDHSAIKAAAFVGSTAVAKLVYRRGIDAGKRMLCLGGAKNHLVVVPDADPEVTAKNIVSSATGCAGQRCMAASVLIMVGNCSAVMAAIEREMRKVVPGENLGSVISAAAKERIEGYINRAEEAGARIPVDGRGAVVEGRENGYYVGSTIIDGVEWHVFKGVLR